jgi:hypothetical protein
MAKTKINVEELLAALKTGDVLLVKATKTRTQGTVQLEFAEKMSPASGFEESAVVSALSVFNASDPRFVRGARRAWLTAKIEDVQRLLDLNTGDDAEWNLNPETGKEELLIGLMNPTANDMALKVRILETVTPDDWQKENVEKAAKRRGKDGDYITHKGMFIFSNTDVVLVPKGVQVPHVRLQGDAPVEQGIKAPVAPVRKGVVDEVGM